ncbi:hypothetical protein CIL05_03335 [Virgibacillus profundi]|uniref:SGNH hydrolase-type esterase domain-containing protein n=1 Tax=Virgibacillus profundi TaxID=2024555 RepID=A0A2A2IG76_9BACI|nr:SGNH/GDSL hydrolase family protein [Virgibacillus profundi]PAV30769.1 hypothetical protein CIL05_03335 [Virgibacillus profundi]PXY54952.1 SGNH/GDSL hydrolase family protein [Virgibacillus profundi]
MEINDLLNRNYFKGCLDEVKTERGIMPVRFTEQQFTEFEKVDFYHPRIRCLAGVTLECNTSSEFIKFIFIVNGRIRDWFNFDIYLNGSFFKSMKYDPIIGEEHEFFLEMPAEAGKLKNVKVYFPQNLEMVINQFEVSDQAICNPVESSLRSLLCYGDSITQGMDALHPSLTYPAILARSLGMNLLNQGVGRHLFDAKVLDDALPYKPDVITVAYGTNDWGRCGNIEQLRKNCDEFYKNLSSYFPEAQIFALTPLWRKNWKEMKATGSFQDVAEVIKDVCSNFQGITVIDGLDLIPHQLHYFNDGVHPNDEGFSKMAENLSERILKAD